MISSKLALNINVRIANIICKKSFGLSTTILFDKFIFLIEIILKIKEIKNNKENPNTAVEKKLKKLIFLKLGVFFLEESFSSIKKMKKIITRINLINWLKGKFQI